jgi:hypothetical protein
VDPTHQITLKNYHAEPTLALLVEELKEHQMMKPLNATSRKFYWIFLKIERC